MKSKIKTKKIVIGLILILLICVCSNEKSEVKQKQETVTNNEEKNYVEPYTDENPIKLGLYLNQNGTKTLTSTYNSPLTQYQDIVSFEVYYTNEPSLTGNQKTLWNQYYQNYQDIDSYKIGYHITFEVGEEKIDKTILNPDDVGSFFDYIQVYLYDDINQESSWYDHITQEEVTAETRFTSIKLTASTKIAEITSPITLTAFTYDTDDFDENNNYRGQSKFQVQVNCQ